MKRFFAIFTVILLILSLVGCGKSGRKIIELTLSTEDSEAILYAAGIRLPAVEETPAAGSTIKWFSFYDSFHNYSEGETVNTGYFTFHERYGCEIEYVETTWADSMTDLAARVLADDSPDFYPCGTGIFPSGAIKGVFQPVDPYINYDDPLWADMKEYAYDYFSLNGHPYFIVTDTSYGTVMCYNRRIIEAYGYEDPADLFSNDEWTWDEFYEMCVDFTDADEDRFALDGWYYPAGILHSCGTSVVEYDTDLMEFVSNVDAPELERANQLLYDLVKNDCSYLAHHQSWVQRNDTNGGGMKDGLLLFYISGDWAFTGEVDLISPVFGDVTKNELMFVPVPRDPNGDGNYYIESSPVGYCIVQGAPNPEGVGLFAACERFKVVDPTVINIDKKQKMEKYLWTEEMLDMWDTCYALANANDTSLVIYGDGLTETVASFYNNFESQGFIQDISSWAQLKEANADGLQAALDELNKTVSEFEGL